MTSEDHYKQLLISTHEIVQQVDHKGFILLANQQWLNVLGYTEDEVIGQSIWDFIAPESVEAGKMAFVRLVQGEILTNISITLLSKTGSAVHVEGCARGLNCGEERFEIHIFLRDITEQYLALESLRQQERELKDLVENLPYGICVISGDYTLLMANLLGHQYLALLSPTYDNGPILHLGNVMIGEILAETRYEVALSSERYKRYEISTHTLSHNNGVARFLLSIRELTYERDIKEKVQQQARLAVVGQMSAGIAHDFNNTLSVIMGTSQLMSLRDDISQQDKEELDRIYAQGQRASEMVRQILNFSRQRETKIETVELSPFIEDISTLLKRILPKSVELRCTIADQPMFIEADVMQLQQLVINLAFNAKDAMPDGGVLDFSIRSVVVDSIEHAPLSAMGVGTWISLAIEDTGIGMAQEVLDRVYEPFYTTKSFGQATGLGLAQVYDIVQQHNACIAVDSEIDRGTLFTIYFPIGENKEEQEKGTSVLKGNGEVILLAEDEESVRVMTASVLEYLGYVVITAEDGQQALELFEQQQGEIDLVVSDVIMPQVNGIELYTKIRERGASVPFVFMSGYSLEDTDSELLPPGNHAWIQKPLDISSIAPILRQAIEAK